jgi:hypothetical protein
MADFSMLADLLLSAEANLDNAMQFVDGFATDVMEVTSRCSTIAAEYVVGLSALQIVKHVGFIGAVIALLPQVQALKTVRGFMVSCTVPMNLTGKRLKKKEPYEGPIRYVMFVFALFLFYQIFSQVFGLIVVATAETVFMDLFFQLSLFIWLLWRMRNLEQVARKEFASDGEKTKRMLLEIDGALSNTGIRLNSVFWTAVVLPLLALAPKAVEATGEQTLFGAWSQLTANLADYLN